MPTPEVEAAKEAASAVGPFAAQNLIPTLWMIGVAMLGGMISFIGKVKAGKARAWNIPELLGELLISGGVGAFTYWILHGLDVNQYLIAAGVGISGHMGSRAIFLLETIGEKALKEWVKKFFGIDIDDPEKTKPGLPPQ